MHFKFMILHNSLAGLVTASNDRQKTMKLFVMLCVFALNACAEWRNQEGSRCHGSDYLLIAGIRDDESAREVPNPKIDLALHKACIEFFYGDHASRMTQLYCLKNDSEKARVVLGNLPKNEKMAVVLTPIRVIPNGEAVSGNRP